MHVKPRWKIFFWHKIYQVQKSLDELYIIRIVGVGTTGNGTSETAKRAPDPHVKTLWNWPLGNFGYGILHTIWRENKKKIIIIIKKLMAPQVTWKCGTINAFGHLVSHAIEKTISKPTSSVLLWSILDTVCFIAYFEIQCCH